MAGVWKRDGTVAVTNGSKKVTGTGTTFADAKNGVAKGHLFCMTTGTTVDLYEVDYVVSNTELHLVQAFRGTTGTGKAYEIITTFSDSIPEFARKLNSSLAYYQSQSDMVQQLFTSDAAEITVTAPDGTTHKLIPWKRVTSEGEGQAARAKAEADKAAVSASAAASAVLAARLPVPDVSIPFTTDGQLLHGKGTPVLVGTTPVSQLVSYERQGSQTMLDKSGRLVTVPAGEMAIEQQGLAIFDQSVNLAAPSINWLGQLTASPWVHSAKDAAGWITVSGAGNPSAAEGSFIEFDVPTADVAHTFSLDILKSTGMQVRIQVQDSGTGRPAFTITELGVTGVGSESVYDMGSYWRVELTRTFLSPTYRKFRIYPFGGAIGSAGAMTYRRLQVEAKPFATPYIENATSAQTTRPATTRCDIPWPGNLQPISDSQELTIAMEFDTAGAPVGAHSVCASGGSGIGSLLLRIEKAGGGTFQALRAASGVTHSALVAPRRRYKFCYRIRKNTCDLFIDGVKTGQSVSAIPSISGVPDVLRLGYISTPDRCLNGHLRSIAIWNAPLTDIQCQAASS